MKVLIYDPDPVLSTKMKDMFVKNGINALSCLSGKECQLVVYRGGIDCVVLDLDTQNYSGVMVLKYIRLNHPSVKVVLTVSSKNRFEELGITHDNLKKLGSSTVLVKPFTDDFLLKNIQGERYDGWKDITLNTSPPLDENILNAKDEEFTKVKIETCQGGNITIFDHYIKLGKGRYVKVMCKGDSFDITRIQKYITDGKMEHLYFKTKDRTTYINFMNDFSKKMVETCKVGSTATIVENLKSTTELYIEEIYTAGIKPQLLEEGMKICQNMFQLVQKDSELAKYIREMQGNENKGNGHLFMVSFFSTIICKNIDWHSEKTTETIAMGGLFHDIGKLKLPPNLRNLEEKDVPHNLLPLFRQHPLFGFEMLSKSKTVSEQVKQIVYQHHELVNGKGYPNQLTAAKIYPLAKIVSLADHFVSLITSQNLTPIDGLRKFIPDKGQTAKYDAMAIKSLVMGLVK